MAADASEEADDVWWELKNAPHSHEAVKRALVLGERKMCRLALNTIDRVDSRNQFHAPAGDGWLKISNQTSLAPCQIEIGSKRIQRGLMNRIARASKLSRPPEP